jgi:two-component system nitrate/nitrite response regulator NarL
MGGTRIFLIIKSRLFREGLHSIFSAPSFEVQHEAASVDEALPKLAEVKPDLLLIDPHGEATALADWIAKVRSAAPSARIVLLTEEIRLDHMAGALSAGVDGYLLKDISGDALQQSLRLVLLGEKVFPTDLAYLLVNGHITPHNGWASPHRSNGLSPREMEILSCLLKGDSNKLIATQLQITESTVKVHLKALLKKINVRNRTQAAIWALNNGIEAVSRCSTLKEPSRTTLIDPNAAAGFSTSKTRQRLHPG